MPKRHPPDHQIYRALREAPDTGLVTGAAREEFARSHPDVKLEPLAVVIAAYNEAGNIGAVLDEITDEIGGVRVSRLVIDDGSTDGTTEVARRHGALVCTLAANRGHGVALRLGYRIAREGGARYIATLDGDGQWDPADLPAMVRILEEGRADFVIGSRQLGRTENTDWYRNAGVRFFAAAISALTHARLTDTSSGLRVMRAELTGVVRQTQPQYQTSRAADRCAVPGFPGGRGAHHHAPAPVGRQQKRRQPVLRLPLRPRHRQNLVARTAPGPGGPRPAAAANPAGHRPDLGLAAGHGW